MKILCFFPIYRASGTKNAYSGGERQFVEICKVWKALGNEIHIVGTIYTKRLCEKFGLKAHIHIFTPVHVRLAGLEEFLNVKKMLDAAPKYRFNLICCPGEPFSYVLSSVLAKKNLKVSLMGNVNLMNPEDLNILSSLKETLTYTEARGGVKFFTTIHERVIFCFKKHLRNLLVKKMDVIFSVSRYIKRLLIKMGIDEKRIYVVRVGVNYFYIRSIVQKFWENKIFDVCFLGNIIPRKGVIDLIKAWRMVVKRRPMAKIVLVGGGKPSYMLKVRNLIEKLGLGRNVLLAGFVPEEEKFKLLAQSKIFVFPSYLEGSPLVLIEAMATGLPIIAYDLPYYRENYGEKIIYVKQGDVKELATTIIHLLEDVFLQERMKKECLELAEQRDWETVAKYELQIAQEFIR
jgi:glycosyltransferase involved in cell wall biosynthesis